MSAKSYIISPLILACAVASANAGEMQMGCNPPTAADLAWMEANLVRVTRVLPNRLAMQRVAAERQVQGLLAAPATGTVAEDGAEIIGVKGGVVAAPAAAPNVADIVMAYPRAVDNSTEAWFPPIGSQRGGSCASFSSTYYLMTSQVARLRGWNVKTDNMDAHKFSTRFTYNLVNEGSGENGTWVTTPFFVMETMGCATYQDLPYNVNDFVSWPTTAAVWRNALNYRMAQSGELRNIDTEAGRANAKQMLADGYIMTFGTQIGEWQYVNFKNDPATSADDGFFAAGVPAVRSKIVTHSEMAPGVSGGHAMTIVGYNDDIWCDLNKNGSVDAGEKGAFRIANSWGDWWEDGGFIWVSYDAARLVSAVPGGPVTVTPAGTGRRPTYGYETFFWMSARPSYTPSLVAEITATHAKRNQMYLGVGRGNNTVTTPTTTWKPSQLQGSGGALAFDGTMVVDCTDVLNSGSGDRWFTSFRDNAAGDAGGFKSVRFIDSNNFVRANGATNPVGGLPKSVDNSTAYFYVDSTDNPPTVATTARATPNPVTGIFTVLSVLGADNSGEANLTYTWATTGNPPAAVTFSANNANAAKTSTVIFSKQGTYNFQCTIKDPGNQTATSSVTVTVNNPSMLPVTAGLALWVDASQLGGLSNGQQVDTWTDMSGKANHALRQSGSSTGYPKYVANGLNGKSVVRFNSANSDSGDYFKFNRLSSIRTVFWVLKENAALSDGHFLLGDDSSYQFHRPSANGPLWDSGNAHANILGGTTKLMGVGVNGTTTALPAGQFQIISLVTTGNVQANQICQDRTFHGSWQGDIAEILIYSSALSASDETLVNNFLASKYGLTASTNSAPTVATAAAATPSPVTGTTTALSVLGADGAGESGLTYTWATTGTPPAAVVFSANNSNAAKACTATFSKAGSYALQCTIKDFFNVSVTSSVTVLVKQTATSVVVTPAAATIPLSATQQFAASLKDQFGIALASQPAITWSLDSLTNGGLNDAGLFTANTTAGGPRILTATSGGKSGTATVRVLNAVPTVVTVATAVLAVDGKSVDLSVLGNDDLGEPALKYFWSLAAAAPAAVTYSANETNAAKNTSATFAQAGRYTFTVAISDAGNLSTTSAVTVDVSESAFAVGSDSDGDSGGGGGGGCGLGSGLAGLAMALMALMRLRVRLR